MFFTKQHSALLNRLEEKIQTIEQTVTGQRTQLDVQISDIKQNIAKLHTSVNKQDMALEDLIEEWGDRKSDEENINAQIREYAQNERRLLELFEAYQEQFWNLKRFVKEKDEFWNSQFDLMEKNLEHHRQLCGINIIGECGTEVDYDLYEVIEVIDTDDMDKDRTIAGVFRCGYLYRGNIIKKAQASVYRYQDK